MSAFLGLDWGSSNLRVFHIDDEGKVLGKRHFPFGITRVQNRAFREMFDTVLKGFPSLPTLICGMAGSVNGWLETPYVQAPFTLSKIASSCVPIEQLAGRESYLIPGLQYRGAFEDVMRGEETQLLGVEMDGRVCLPGTHSKWAQIQMGEVTSFQTYMTGELFSLLSKEGLIASLMKDGDFDDKAFIKGVQQATTVGGFLHQLFSARSRTVTGELAQTSVSHYLSGLLIGTEILSTPITDTVCLIGEGILSHRYQLALSTLFPNQIIHTIHSDTVVVRGLSRIWEALNA